ncbi:MAG: hypothetical protein JWL83_79 [Actinomycetia bacterium]|nr:hypothetical protein [Actinomycetes bacterium]
MNAAYAAAHDPTAVIPRRVLAYAIDVAITAVVFVALAGALSTGYDKHGGFVDLSGVHVCDALKQRSGVQFCFENKSTAYTLTPGGAALAFGVPALVSLLNLVVLQGVTGASVGKRITGLRVIDADGNFGGIGRAFIRWLLLVVDGVFVVVGLVVTLVTHPHRRIGDFAAGTYVVGAPDVGHRVGEAVEPPPTYDRPAAAVTAPTQTPTPTPSTPVWDAVRGAWVSYDPGRGAWLRYDDANGEWHLL